MWPALFFTMVLCVTFLYTIYIIFRQKKVAQAKADSAAIAVQMQALKQQSGKEYLTLKWIEKWNGQLPSVVTNDKMIPMLNLGN